MVKHCHPRPFAMHRQIERTESAKMKRIVLNAPNRSKAEYQKMGLKHWLF